MRRWWTRGLPVASGAIVLGLAAYAWPFTIDDAYIPCRYAAHLAGGAGLVWNPGEHVQGITGLGWTLLLALVRLAGISDLPGAAKGLGLLAGVATVAWTVRSASRTAGGTRGVALGTLLVLAPSLSVVAYSIAGLETMAFTLLVTLAAGFAGRRAAAAGLCAGLTVVLRPEGALVWIVLLAFSPRARRRRFLTTSVPVLLVLAAVQWTAFGAWLPLTLHARRAPAGAGVSYLLGALAPTGALVLWPLAIAGAAAVRPTGCGWRGPVWRTRLAVIGALVVATVVEGGDWMPGWRFLVPVWPLTAWLAARGAWRASLLLSRRGTNRLAARLPALLFCLGLLAGGLSTILLLPDVRQAGLERQRAAPHLVRALERLGAHRVALVDVGYVGWAGGFTTVDLGGLTNQAIAQAPGTYLDKAIDEHMVLGAHPDAIVLHATAPDGRGMFPVERRVARMPAVAARYRRAAAIRRSSDYWYLVLTSRRPP